MSSPIHPLAEAVFKAADAYNRAVTVAGAEGFMVQVELLDVSAHGLVLGPSLIHTRVFKEEQRVNPE